MAPKRKGIDLLFHPKKKTRPPPLPPAAADVPSQSTFDSNEDDANGGIEVPQGSFVEYKIMSTADAGWKYDVMKFEAHKPIEITDWKAPIKLNRKDIHREDRDLAAQPQAVAEMHGLDGRPVVGADGNIVMVDADGRPIRNNPVDKDKGKEKGQQNGRRKFQKKTRQVFLVDEATRQLRKEERYPWVLHDASGEETWIAQLDDPSKSKNYGFLMPAQSLVFKFVPAHRWYKFQKRRKGMGFKDTATMEQEFALMQKQNANPYAFYKKIVGKDPSAETTKAFTAAAEGKALIGGKAMREQRSQMSEIFGGRRLKHIARLPGQIDEDDEGVRKRIAKEYGQEGDFDEMAWEEEFADDDEKVIQDGEDEEAKEAEERLKREYKNANKMREGDVDEDEEEDELFGGKPSTKQEKAMQKLIRNREGNNAYESEEEENPYASSDEDVKEEDEEIVPPAMDQKPGEANGKASTPQTSSTGPTPTGATIAKPVVNGSIRVTPTPGRPSSPPSVTPPMGGHSVVAKRATSPKGTVKQPKGAGSRASSPLASVALSRSGSPAAAATVFPTSNGAQKKRKATDEPGSPTVGEKAKKRKHHNHSAALAPLDIDLVVKWMASMEKPTTKDCINYFSAYTKDSVQRTRFTEIMRQIVFVKDGIMVLKPQYRHASPPRDDSPPPS
ncbi:Rap30/74 interaction domain-containing protein [Fistulina hepatica ATCC 64428]|nr:Rap30/74 interaction domain-containing protein [Fistulina hepatica ATCC 64428]